MAEYIWYKATVDQDGTALTDSVAVTIWFGPEPPLPGTGPYDLVIIDSDGDGLIGTSEWRDATGSGGGRNLGGAFSLFDFTPPQVGNLYSSTPYTAGTTGLLDGLSQGFDPIDPDLLVICFVAGVLIETPDGPRPVETLAAGDQVTTLDHGSQTIRAVWSGERPGVGPYAPVRIAAGVLAARRDLLLSQNHRVLVRHPQVGLLFGHSEALVMAKSLVGGATVRLEPCNTVRYIHLLLESHEIVAANGVAAETFFPGSYLANTTGLTDLDTALFGQLPTGATETACRPLLSHVEGRLLARLILLDNPTQLARIGRAWPEDPIAPTPPKTRAELEA